MRLNAKRPSSVHVTKLNVLSFLTPVQMVFSIQTHITEKVQSKLVLGSTCSTCEMCLNSKHHFHINLDEQRKID